MYSGEQCMSGGAQQSASKRRHREVQSSAVAARMGRGEGGKGREREGGMAVGQATVTVIWQWGGGISSFNPTCPLSPSFSPKVFLHISHFLPHFKTSWSTPPFHFAISFFVFLIIINTQIETRILCHLCHSGTFKGGADVIKMTCLQPKVAVRGWTLSH